MPDWRSKFRNSDYGDKQFPYLVSPGGRIAYRGTKFPQLPAPNTLEVDHPYIILDNWAVLFFPVTRSALTWLGESLAHWRRQRPTREYRGELNAFLAELEHLCATRPF
jgi:hypothetical protein